MSLLAASVPVFAPTAFDTYSLIASGYCLRRGGMRVGINTQNSAPHTIDWLIAPAYEGGTGGTTFPNVFTSSSATVPATAGQSFGANTISDMPTTWGGYYTDFAPGNCIAMTTGSTAGTEVEIPQVHMNPSCLIPIETDTSKLFDTYSDSVIQKGVLSVTNENTHTYTKLYRAASDDHQLGYFIGFLPWVVALH